MEIPNPLSVTEFIELMNVALKTFEVKIIGEVTMVKIAASGHVYFTLKDKAENAVIECVIWKGNYRLQGIDLENGMEVILHGHPEVYANWGKLSFITKTIERVGEGALKEAYERLKRKLTEEGIFDESRKRPLPTFPHKIGVITSMHGAVIHDFENNIGLHGFNIIVTDSRVEGQEALPDLLAAIHTMKRQDIEALVIMRGGGSLQSLAAFDNETIIREVASFPVPVIAAIGHHTDVPLMSLAADVMVSTPTAAAALLNTQWQRGKEALSQFTHIIHDRYYAELQLIERALQHAKDSITGEYEALLSLYAASESRIYRHVHTYESYLHQIRQQLHMRQISMAYQFSLNSNLSALTHAEKVIELNNPERLLKKGFSILRKNGKIIRSIEQVTVDDLIEANVSDGSISSIVTKKFK